VQIDKMTIVSFNHKCTLSFLIIAVLNLLSFEVRLQILSLCHRPTLKILPVAHYGILH